jgi:uncharacterized protein (DUF2461 family)
MQLKKGTQRGFVIITKLIDLDKITNRDFCITHNIKTIKLQQIKTTI